MGRRDAGLQGSDTAVRDAARSLELDRYLAALLSPRPARPGLIALAAFLGEIARIPATVSEPAMGDIRLQWWREALTVTPPHAATGSPVADAMRQTMQKHALPRSSVLPLIDAYSHSLVPGSLAALGAVDAYADATQGAAFRLAAHILGVGDGAAAETYLAAAAQSYGRVQLLRSLPALVTKGRNPFGEEAAADLAAAVQPVLAEAKMWLTEARRRASAAPATIRPAVLPLALVEPYLAALERLGPNVASQRAEISPLTRVWRLYRAGTLSRV
jgi:15-cis-phytoene synthase